MEVQGMTPQAQPTAPEYRRFVINTARTDIGDQATSSKHKNEFILQGGRLKHEAVRDRLDIERLSDKDAYVEDYYDSL